MNKSFFFLALCVIGLAWGTVGQVHAQSNFADGVPGIPSYQEAAAFAQSYFLSTSDYQITSDPDGGYAIVYSPSNYNPLDVQAALRNFLSNEAIIDLESQVIDIINPLIVRRMYSLTMRSYPVGNFSEIRQTMESNLVVPLVLQFDYLRDGFDTSTEDFSLSGMLDIDQDGRGTIVIQGLTFADPGNWRYRMIIDPNALYEPASNGTRANNTSAWSNFTVVDDTPEETPISSDNDWKIISDFDSYGPAYSGPNTTCSTIRAWVCDVRAGEPVPRVDLIVDGQPYDTFYPTIPAYGVVNPWWANQAEYGYMPGCPARPGNTYGFSYVTPAALKDGEAHTFQLRATRSDGFSNYIVNAGWTPVIKEFSLQCAPEVNVVDLAAYMEPLENQEVDTPFSLSGLLVKNQGDLPTGAPFQVRLIFDHGTDGFDPEGTSDFMVTRTLTALAAGNEVIPNFGSVTNATPGQWRVAMVADPGLVVEPAEYGYRGNNRTGWHSYQVIDLTDTVGTGLPACQLTASNDRITAGDTTTLSWRTTDAISSATISGVGPVNATDDTANAQVQPPSTRTYTMTVTNTNGDSRDCSETVVVESPPTVDLRAVVNDSTTYTAPTTMNLSNPGDKLSITWAGQNVVSCTKSFVIGSARSGTEVFDPAAVEPGANNSYTVSCENAAGRSVTKSISATVPSFTIDLALSDSLVRPGKAVEIDYDVLFPAGANYQVNCEFSGAVTGTFSTAVTESGTRTTRPLNSSSVASLTCVEPVTGYTLTSEELIEVVPSYQEI